MKFDFVLCKFAFLNTARTVYCPHYLRFIIRNARWSHSSENMSKLLILNCKISHISCRYSISFFVNWCLFN